MLGKEDMLNRRHLLARMAALAALTIPGTAQAVTPAKAKKPEKKKPKQAKAAAVVITINKASQKMTVEVNGRTEYRWPVSTGARGYDTPSGRFRPFRMEREHFSNEWDDAPMPHSIFFTARGHAVHGSYHVKSLGRRASHGCVRLHPSNAAKLFALVQKHGMSSTAVVVTGGFFDFGRERPEKPAKKGKKKFLLFGALED
jgi:lipoprotein-anchoring transpeptidase ErfK/SrfK